MNPKKLIKASIFYTISNLLVKSISFLLIPFLTYSLTAEEYGLLNIYITYETILTIFIGTALHTTLRNAQNEFGSDFINYCKIIFIIPILNFLGYLIIINIFKDLFLYATNLSYFLIILMGINSLLDSIIMIYNSYISISYSYLKYSLLSIINIIANVILTIYFILNLFHGYKVLGRILAIICPLLAFNIFIFIDIFKKRTIKSCNYKKFIFFAYKFSIPLIFHGLSQCILSNIDRVMIQKILGLKEAGIYSLVYNAAIILQVISMSISVVWGNFFYDSFAKKKYFDIKKNFIIYSYFFLIICISAILIFPDFIYSFMPEEYWSGISSIIPIVASSFFVFLYNFPVQIEYFYKKTKYVALGTILSAFINLIGNYFAIRFYGIYGAAMMTLISYISYFLFHYFISNKIYPNKLFPYKIIINQMFILFIICFFTYISLKIDVYKIVMYILVLIFIIKKIIKYNRIVGDEYEKK